MSWTVADVMTRDVVVVEPEEDFQTCVRLLNLYRISALPVVDRVTRRLVGIVSESDLLAKERERGTRRSRLGRFLAEDKAAIGRTAGDVMTFPVISIQPTASLPEAARLMHRKAVKRLVVVDTRDAVVGIVSRADLLKTFMRSDESIRREVAEDLLLKVFSIDPAGIDVTVEEGLVRIGGEVETRSLAGLIVRMIERIEGTVGVESRLKYRLDDTRLEVEAPAGALQLSAQERAGR